LVFVKNLLILRIFVEFSAQLEPVIFTHSVNLTVLGQVYRVLEAEGHLSDLDLGKRLDQERLLSVDVILGAEL
jgi:hypothetical protein